MGLSAGSNVNHGFNICKFFHVESFHGLQPACLDSQSAQSVFDMAVIRSSAVFSYGGIPRGESVVTCYRGKAEAVYSPL